MPTFSTKTATQQIARFLLAQNLPIDERQKTYLQEIGENDVLWSCVSITLARGPRITAGLHVKFLFSQTHDSLRVEVDASWPSSHYSREETKQHGQLIQQLIAVMTAVEDLTRDWVIKFS